VRGWLARERRIGGPHVLPEEVYRACHTLAGSSTMAEARHGIRLADPMNHWLRKAFDSGVGLDDSDLFLLGDCMVAMEAVAGHLDEGTGFFVMHDTLRGRIARAELDLDRRIAEANEFAGSQQHQPVGTAAAAATRPPIEPEYSQPSQPQAPPPPPPQPQQAAAPPPQPQQAAAPPAAAAVRPPDVMPATPRDGDAAQHAGSGCPAGSARRRRRCGAVDFDPEIAAIFSEEAVELLEAAESALAAWNASRRCRPGGGIAPAAAYAQGRRAHGRHRRDGRAGARTGKSVGRIEIGLASADDAARGVAQEALDELARMREATASGRPAARARR
jgi:chemotaxis protein histidine kinase CheA